MKSRNSPRRASNLSSACSATPSVRQSSRATRAQPASRRAKSTSEDAPPHGRPSHPRAHMPKFRKEFDLQHSLEIADAGRAASAPLEADHALDCRHVVETPAPEIVLEVDKL